eukprot:8121374-Pyramimonas_sp.AAC.1
MWVALVRVSASSLWSWPSQVPKTEPKPYLNKRHLPGYSTCLVVAAKQLVTLLNYLKLRKPVVASTHTSLEQAVTWAYCIYHLRHRGFAKVDCVRADAGQLTGHGHVRHGQH